MAGAHDTKPAVAIAGPGDLAKFFIEELARDVQYRIVILSRTRRDWFIRPDVDYHTTDYSPSSILSILDSTSSIVLFSFIYSEEPGAFTSVHNAMLSACAASRTCHRLVPSEYGGNITDSPRPLRVFESIRAEFRRALIEQEEVEWTLVNGGWFMDYFVAPEKTYIKPWVPGWPIDLERFTARITGTGEEKIGWTAARDVARALVKLVGAESWEKHTYVVGEIGTWNAAIKLLEEFHNRSFARQTKSAEEIQAELAEASFDEPGTRMAAEMDAWNISGASAVPWSEVEKQRKMYFEGVRFRTIRELLEDGEKHGVV